MGANVSQLIFAALSPREDWRPADRVREIAAVWALNDTDPDAYWVWAAREPACSAPSLAKVIDTFVADVMPTPRNLGEGVCYG